tara:strand:- start:222387 stop:224249 length:1863 start_codon:yes stop_codon:yes gene_type:complete
MSETQTTIAKDIFPRVLVVALLAVIAWVITNHIDQADQNTWLKTLYKANNEAVQSLEKNIQNRLSTVEKLATDQRLEPLFSAEFTLEDAPSKLARRAIYEFKYINEIDHVYVFSSILNEVVLTSAGSADLPSLSLEPFYNAAKYKLDRITNIALIGGQSYILLGKAIRGATGSIVGYAIYTDSTRNFFNNIANDLKLYNDIAFNTYMLEEDSAIAIEDFTRTASSMRMVKRDTTPFPIFQKSFQTQKFTDEFGASILAVGGFYKEIPKWKITTEVDMLKVNEASNQIRLLLFTGAVFAAIALFLFPFQGPYSESLRRLYRKIGIMKRVAETPKIDIGSLERMRESALNGGMSWEEHAALKLQKESGKNKQKEDYTPSDAVIAYNIRTGMKNKRIKLLYQPILHARTGRVFMHEVFLRIIDDEGKIMPPSMWLPVAKKEDLFSLIDETVVTVAMEKYYVRKAPLQSSLAFNISGNTFGSLAFLEKLMISSSSSHPISEHTVFELHSKEIIEDKRAMSFIKECREMGFRFAIDYFGGGPQTLKAAKTLKFDYMKIDILRFDLDQEKDQKAFVKLIKTAQAIELPIVVEKIEDERSLRFCKRIGVDYVQGYHISEPNPDLYKK